MNILNYIETFATVVDKGSFTGAARALQISKPVVSKQVSQLEQHLGVQLLHRTTRQLNPTEAGKVFAHYAQNIMEQAHEAKQSVLPLQSDPQGILRITAPESLAISILPEALTDFLQRYPNLELDVQVSGQFVDLLEMGIDVALRVGKLEDSSLIARRLMPCRFYVCATQNYWDQHGTPKHPNDLKTHNCLVYSQSPNSDTWFFKEKNGKAINVKVKGNFRSSSGQLLVNAALNGQGILLAPSYMVDNAIRQVELVPVLDKYLSTAVGLYAIYPHSQFVSPKVRIFIDFLIEKLGDNT